MSSEHHRFFTVCALFFAGAACAVLMGGEPFVRAAQHPRSMMTIGFLWTLLGIYGYLLPPHRLTRRVSAVILSLGAFQLLFARGVTPTKTPSVGLSGALLVILALLLIGLSLMDRFAQKSQSSLSSDTIRNSL